MEFLVSQHGYHAVRNGKERGGTALFIRTSMKPCIRKVLTSGPDGRMSGVVMEQNGKRVVMVSVYMPTGLDFVADASSASEAGTIADKLYRQLLRWTTADVCDHALVLGDLNETMSSMDQSSAAGKSGRWISCLPSADSVDAFRSIHGTDLAGFTHCAKRAGGRLAQSRLDYLFVRGWNVEDIRQCEVLQSLQVSNHRLAGMGRADLCSAVAASEWSANSRTIAQLAKCK